MNPERFQYETCCVNSTAEAIHNMTDDASEISYNTFAKRCDIKELKQSLGYSRDFFLKRDWHVSYHKSIYLGRPCYYMVHSAIEYIFVAPPNGR